jgi:hypothetical protein
MKKGTKEQVWPSRASRLFGADIVRLLQRGGIDEFAYYARAKRSSILFSWVSGVALGEIESAHTLNPFYPIDYGTIRGFADTTRFLLRSVADIANLITPREDFDIEPVLKQLAFGLPEGALALVDLPVPLVRGEYLALWRAGLVTPEQVLEAPLDLLSTLLGKQNLLRLSALRA